MKKQNIKGLTLVEFIIVFFVLAILILILLPATHPDPNEYPRRNVCMANQRNIVLSWYMYAEENDCYIPNSDTFANTENTNWISGPIDENGKEIEWQNCSQEDEIRGIEKSPLYKYIQDAGIFNCSASSRYYKDAPLGYRTYSIPSTLNGSDLPEDMEKYRYTKLDQIMNPAETFMLAEEADTRGFNYNGWFQNPEEPDTIHDSIGIFHKNSSNFGFCDGHVETIKWTNPKTSDHFENYIKTNTNGNFNFTDPDNEDIQKIHKYYPVKK